MQQSATTAATIGLTDGVRLTAFLLLCFAVLQMDITRMPGYLTLHALSMALIFGIGSWATVRKEQMFDIERRKAEEAALLENIGLPQATAAQDAAFQQTTPVDVATYSPLATGLRTALFYVLGAALAMVPLLWSTNHETLMQYSIPWYAILISATGWFRCRSTGTSLFTYLILQLLFFSSFLFVLRYLVH